MSMEKDTYLIYGIVLPVIRKSDDDGQTRYYLGDSDHHLWEDEMLPYIEGREWVACSLLYGEAPANKAYFGLVLASTSGQYENEETDVTGWFGLDNRDLIDRAIQEISNLFGKDSSELRLIMADIIS